MPNPVFRPPRLSDILNLGKPPRPTQGHPDIPALAAPPRRFGLPPATGPGNPHFSGLEAPPRPGQGAPPMANLWVPPRPGFGNVPMQGLAAAPLPGQGYPQVPGLVPPPHAAHNSRRPPPSRHFSRPTNILARFPSLPDGDYIPGRPLHYGRYLLWKGQRTNSELIISSHGTRVFGRQNVIPQGMALHFYGPDYASVATVNIYRAFIEQEIDKRPYQIIRAGQTCSDYLLTKFQGASETFDHVRKCLPYYDVVTIETTPDQDWTERVQLSELLEHLRLKKHRYKRIHCFFCRSLSRLTEAEYPAVQPLVLPPYSAR